MLNEPIIVTARRVRAARALVWDHHTDPTKLARWWGPEGFTNEVERFELRPGGAWHHVMRGPDGAVYRMEKRLLEVLPPERLVHEHLDPVHSFRMTITLAEEAGETLLTWVMRFDSPEEHARVKEFIAQANEQNLDRLEAALAAT